MALSNDEIEIAQNLITNLQPNNYELEEIYGEHWQAIEGPTSFGRLFKESVLDGKLRGIRSIGRTAENHQLYRVFRV